LKFFVDNCLAPRYAKLLGALDYGEVTSLREHFAPNTTDVVWITELGERGWVLLSLDRSQRSKPPERAALKASGVIAFYFAKGFDHLPLDEQAWRIVKFWPAIAARAEAARKGECYMVRINGKIDPLL